MIDVLFLLLGLGVLIGGGEFLVKGAVGFSFLLRISPLVIGMTVVAFGTSAPELIVSMRSALDGNPGIAIGNVIGSNIANLALVLGVTVLIFPIFAGKETKIVDFPMMFFATLLFYYFAIDGEISFSDGVILFTILIGFILFLVSRSRKKNKRNHKKKHKKKEHKLEDKKHRAVKEHKKRDDDEDDDEDEEEEDDDDDDDDEFEDGKIPLWKSGLFLSIGLIGLYFGAEWFVKGAVGIAEYFLEDNPDRDLVIGVTVVAFGTSAPELVASCVAAYRKQTDISVGNLIGSNIFNIFAVIGLTSIATPISVSQKSIDFDMLWMIGIAMLLGGVLYIGKRIGRVKGVILILSYVVYIGLIIMSTKGMI